MSRTVRRLALFVRPLLLAAACAPLVAAADVRPEIAWSANFNGSSGLEGRGVSVVRFSETEPDMLYFAGAGTALSVFRDPNGDHYDGYPYTTILPSPDPVGPSDRAKGLYVGKINYRTNQLQFLTFVKTEPKSMTNVTDMDFDENGNIYLVGNAQHFAEQFSVLPQSFGFVGCRSNTATGSSSDGVFVKLNADATQILRSCFWGYSGDDSIQGIAVIRDGEFMLVGETTSNDFSVNNEDQTTLNGTRDAYYAYFINDGSLLFGSYLGGSGEEALLDVTYTASGRLLASGATLSADFPVTADAYQGIWRSNIDSVIVEFDLDRQGNGPNVQYATFLGGSGNDSAQAIVEDGYGDIYVVGTSNSQDYPIMGSVANTPVATAGLVVTKFDSAISRLRFSTFEGDPLMNFWSGESIAVSEEGDIVVTGTVDFTDPFPWFNRLLELDDPLVSTFSFFVDGYLFKWLNSSTGYTRDYTTLLGGGGGAYSVDIAAPGVVAVSGNTQAHVFVDKTYWTVPEAIMGDYASGPYAMVVTNDIPARQLPPVGGGGSGGGGSGGGGGGGGGMLSPWLLAVLAGSALIAAQRRRRGPGAGQRRPSAIGCSNFGGVPSPPKSPRSTHSASAQSSAGAPR